VTGPIAVLLPGNRLHLQHGPIDLIVEAFGEPGEVERAYGRAKARFDSLLGELVQELPKLKRACPRQGMKLKGAVARRMERAVRPFAPEFITPMAAVAGAVSDEVLAALMAEGTLRRAYVNNGGDLALHLAAGETFRVGVAPDPRSARLTGSLPVEAGQGIGGVATSGRGGRSFSLGIADAVTVAGGSAAAADAAATMIANAVDLPGSPKVRRAPARALDPDSDLGERPVTIEIGPLGPEEIDAALGSGEAYARRLIDTGRIRAAVMILSGRVRGLGLWSAAPVLLGGEVEHA